MTTSLPRDGYCLLSLTLPRTRIRGGCSCNVRKWSSNEAHCEGEGGVQYKEASKVNSALAAVEICENSHGPVTPPLKTNNRQRRSSKIRSPTCTPAHGDIAPYFFFRKKNSIRWRNMCFNVAILDPKKPLASLRLAARRAPRGCLWTAGQQTWQHKTLRSSPSPSPEPFPLVV